MSTAPPKGGENAETQGRGGKVLQERYLLHPGQSFQQVLHQPSTFCTAKQRQRQK